MTGQTPDPRTALATLVGAFERHLEASSSRRGENDPAVVAAYQDLADAFDTYDDVLLDAYGEVTPLEIYTPDDDEDDDEDDGDPDADADADDEGGYVGGATLDGAIDPLDDELDDHDDEDGDDEEVYVGLNDSDFEREDRDAPSR